MGIPVKVNADSSGKPSSVPAEGEQPSERSDAGVMIVPEVFGFVKPPGSKVFRSEAEELRRGFGVQGKGAASPFIPCLSL